LTVGFHDESFNIIGKDIGKNCDKKAGFPRLLSCSGATGRKDAKRETSKVVRCAAPDLSSEEEVRQAGGGRLHIAWEICTITKAANEFENNLIRCFFMNLSA